MRNRAVTPRLADWVEPRFIQLALKNMQITNVADLFDILDEYGAGVLRPERLIKAVHDQGIGSPEAEYLVSSYPLNDRGVIERQDFINRAATMVDKPSGEPPSSGWGCLVQSIISCKPSPSRHRSPILAAPNVSFDNLTSMHKMIAGGPTQTAEAVEKMLANAMFSRYRTVKQAFWK